MTAEVHPEQIVIALACPDKPGIVHAVSEYIVRHQGDILDSQQYGDPASGDFFMRVHVKMLDHSSSLAGLRESFGGIAESFGMSWSVSDAAARPRVAIMVSRFDHCLNDLLFRWRSGQLPIEIPVIVSNHEDLRPTAEWYGVDFVRLPVTAETKAQAETDLLRIVDEHSIDLVVLARYMQVLSDELCTQLAGRAINIHHSFLPSFKGGKPYHQAHDRGVKLVGATAHYVTADLDEGPIIDQQVVRVDHRYSARDLVVAGRDVECKALANAVQWHAENRVLLNGHRTVVFD